MARTPATPTTTANTTATATVPAMGTVTTLTALLALTPAHRAHARPGAGRLLLLVCVAQLMVILDITAVNVALPQLADGLHINGSDIGWTITSYSLIFGSLLLLGGRAADLIGRRRMFLTGLGIFTAASVASALAASATALFAARAGQGLGAAMLSPAALSIIMATFTEGHERARALGAWGAVGGAGAAVGVLLGGALTSLIGWQAIFLINVPVGLALAVTAIKIVPADADRPQWRGLDLRGAVLATGSLGAIVFALSQATSAGWTSLQTLGIGGAGILGLVAFALVEMHTAQPLLQIQRLADRGVGGGFVMMLAASAVLFGTFLLSRCTCRTSSAPAPWRPAWPSCRSPIAIAAGVHAGSHAVTHAGVRIPMAFGFAVTAAGMLLLSGVGAGGSYLADVLPGMIVAGLGLGLILVSVSVSVMTGAARAAHRHALRPEHHRARDRRHDRHRHPRHRRDGRRRRRDKLSHETGLRHQRCLPRRRRDRRSGKPDRPADPARRGQLPAQAAARPARRNPLGAP